MKKDKKLVEMWRIKEEDGTYLSFMTVQEEIAVKLCEAKKGRMMEKVMVSI